MFTITATVAEGGFSFSYTDVDGDGVYEAASGDTAGPVAWFGDLAARHYIGWTPGIVVGDFTQLVMAPDNAKCPYTDESREWGPGYPAWAFLMFEAAYNGGAGTWRQLDNSELGTLMGRWVYTSTGPLGPGPVGPFGGEVPIPSAVLLLGSGLLRLACYRRKLRKG
jgi:hypothetical protein